MYPAIQHWTDNTKAVDFYIIRPGIPHGTHIIIRLQKLTSMGKACTIFIPANATLFALGHVQSHDNSDV